MCVSSALWAISERSGKVERQSEVLVGCQLVRSGGCLKLSGEIDPANVALIEERVLPLIADPVTVLDLGAVTFLDAAGVRMLARFGGTAGSANAVLRVRCSAAVSLTLRLCGFEKLPGLSLIHEEF